MVSQQTGVETAGLDEKHWLNSCYAQWFNWRHGHKGHAFFRRFHSVLIKTDSQLAEVARYILLNLCAHISSRGPRTGPGAATAP